MQHLQVGLVVGDVGSYLKAESRSDGVGKLVGIKKVI